MAAATKINIIILFIRHSEESCDVATSNFLINYATNLKYFNNYDYLWVIKESKID